MGPRKKKSGMILLLCGSTSMIQLVVRKIETKKQRKFFRDGEVVEDGGSCSMGIKSLVL